jgi:Uri superfamily endonuclease
MVYCVVYRIREHTRVRVGRLGVFEFGPGYYVYTGSAKTGIAARLARHARKSKPRKRWHIDYLSSCARFVGAYAFHEAVSECALNSRIAALPGASQPIRGFGSSDCRCRSHLTYFADEPDIASLEPGYEYDPDAREKDVLKPRGKKRRHNP